MGTSESDSQPAPSVVHDAFSAVSANGFSKTQEVIYMDAHPQPFTNSQDEFAQVVQGKGWTIPQVAKGLEAFPRSVEEFGFDFQEGRALLDESEQFADNVPATRLTYLSLDTADLRTDQSVKATYMAWSSKLLALTYLHHPVYGASTWLGTGLPGDWQPDSDYESSISDLATGYKGCLNLKHVAIGAARSQTYGDQIHEIDLCHDLSEKVANIFKNNYINLETISVNLSGSNPFFGAAKPRSFLVEKDGTVGEVSDYDTGEHLTKDTCSLLGLETSLELVNYLPAELLKIMPSDKVSFEEHWNR
ncbi:hypothetical protein SLS60_006503 [Paraconiothyrium brasiliense]|uniref:Uncharacterized protein n=1 Tax=Paraconiothyrium brasiliense TaxID=300254 RepID=A0ABR3RBI4_9PLEO